MQDVTLTVERLPWSLWVVAFLLLGLPSLLLGWLFTAVLNGVLLVVTFGLSLLALPSLWPIVAFFYNGSSVSGPRMATPGMRMFDLELRTTDGHRASFLAAALHGVMLYFSWMFPPVFLASLVTPDKRCLHDILAGLVAVRRPD